MARRRASRDLALPEPAVMEEAIAAVSAWKRAQCLLETTRGCSVRCAFSNIRTRWSPSSGSKYGASNVIAEAFSAYHDGLVDEYLRARGPAKTLDMAT